jgi:adenylate kinase family enzyme
VVGLAGAGKTTLARQLAQTFALPHIELDGLYWEADWTPAPPELFRHRVEEALSQESWLAEGNHDRVSDLVWQKADTLIWLDLSLPLLMGQLLGRTISNLFSQAELWNGNREQWSRHFLSSRSIFLKLLKSYYPKRQKYLKQLKQPEHAALRVIRLRSPQAIQGWLIGLKMCVAELASGRGGMMTYSHQPTQSVVRQRIIPKLTSSLERVS